MIKKISFRFSELLKRVPTVNFQAFLGGKNAEKECEVVRQAFHEFSCVIVKDPRVTEQKNETFLDLLERYFSKRQKQLDAGQRVDIYPQKEYEVGLTPPYTLKAIEHTEMAEVYTKENAILTPFPGQPLSKLRFLWNIGAVTEDIPANVVPEDFPEIEGVFNDWGQCMFDAINTTSQMLALGLKLPQNTLTEQLAGGANKLAPNANDLRRCKKGEPFTGIHYDFSFMTIHGKSRYPGLFIWLPNGEKLKISIPKGHLLIQAGSELEHVTGGYIKSGFHEAINTPQVQAAMNKAIGEGKEPWRITSTMFTHLRSDVTLQPLPVFSTPDTKAKYRSVKQSDYMMQQIAKVRAKGGQ